jgi:biopolymer transport protein ExbD
MRIRTQPSRPSKLKLQTSAMIDIVFLLLVFFVMTFQIVPLEGDFNVKTSRRAGPGVRHQPTDVPIRIRMTAGQDGRLTSIRMNDRVMDDMGQLHHHIKQLAASVGGPEAAANYLKVELECDQQLNYEHVIDGITAVSGYLDQQGNVVRLIENVRFVSPRRL